MFSCHLSQTPSIFLLKLAMSHQLSKLQQSLLYPRKKMLTKMTSRSTDQYLIYRSYQRFLKRLFCYYTQTIRTIIILKQNTSQHTESITPAKPLSFAFRVIYFSPWIRKNAAFWFCWIFLQRLTLSTTQYYSKVSLISTA